MVGSVGDRGGPRVCGGADLPAVDGILCGLFTGVVLSVVGGCCRRRQRVKLSQELVLVFPTY